MTYSLTLSLFTFLTFLSSHIGLAQDTIYVTEEPLVIKKKIHVTKELPALPKRTFLYYSLQTGFSINRDYYAACATPICMDYYLKVRSATKPLYNNIVSFSIGFISNRFVLEPSLSYSLYRDRFTYDNFIQNEKEEINYYHQLDFSLKPGYYFDTKKSRYYLLLKAGPSLSYLANVSGLTYSKDNPNNVSNLNKEFKFNLFSYRLGMELSLGKKAYNKPGFISTLFYSYDLLSIINKKDYFTRQRNVLGIKIGVIFLKRTSL
jgi:hypothetical protein